MIKRRFYKQDRGDDSGSDNSSSSSSDDFDSSPEVEDEEDDEVEEEVGEDEEAAMGRGKEVEKRKRRRTPSPGSRYESGNSSGNEIGADSSEEDGTERGVDNLKEQLINEAHVDEPEEGASSARGKSFNPKDPIQAEIADCMLKCKSVFKCRLCPRIVCLSEGTVRTHLNSKGHARSKKLLREGRLKLMLNNYGEVEEDRETHTERHNRTVAIAQESIAPKRKDKGRHRQSQRRKKRLHNGSDKGKSERLSKSPVKKKKNRKNEDLSVLC